MSHPNKKGKVIHARDICEKAVIIDNACLIVYAIFITQCPFGTQKIADDPKKLLISVNNSSVQNW